MTVGWRRTILGATTALCVCALSVVAVRSQATVPESQMADEVFENVQVLKGLTVDQFMEVMGMFAAATTKDCSGCHDKMVLTESRDYFKVTTPLIQRARQMIVMTNALNRTYFGGEARVSCFSCHHAADVPDRSPDIAVQYGVPPPFNTTDSIVLPYADPSGDTAAAFARLVESVGGAEALTATTSLVGTGTYSGWDTSRAPIPYELYAGAPGQLTQISRRREGNIIMVSGDEGAWLASVDGIIPILDYTGDNRTGMRVEALAIGAPHMLEAVFTDWTYADDFFGDDHMTVLQSSEEGQPPVRLYIDDTGMLVRLVRWNETPVGPVPTQLDFSDFREVAGVMRPFKIVRSWTNNQAEMILEDLTANVPVEPARFLRPEPANLR
jgi:hypothetical protein